MLRSRSFIAVFATGVLFAGATSVLSMSADVAANAAPSSVADAPSADDVATAQAIALTYGHPVTVNSMTTSTGEVAAQPDGTMQLTESSQPVRVEQDGQWTAIDTSLEADAAGFLAPTASASPVEFSAGGSGPLARVQSPDGSWVSESWQAGALPTPSVTDSTATYPEVFPGVDLSLTATPTGMTSVLVVKTAQAAADPQLNSVNLSVAGASLSPITGTGSTSGSTGSTAAQSSAGVVSASPSWWDSGELGAGPGGPGGADLPRPVPDEVTAHNVSIDAAAVASGPNVAYPVYVDPDWTGGVLARTFVDSAYPTQSYYNGGGASDSCQHVGYIDAGDSDDGKAHTTRAYWRMNISQVDAAHIYKATFDLTETWAYSAQTSGSNTAIDLFSTSNDFSPGTTWNSRLANATHEDSQNFVHGYVAGGNSCPSGSGGTPVGFDATGAVATHAGNGDQSVTLALQAANESSYYGWKKFRPAATLVISYDTVPSVPAGRAVAPCWAVCGLTSSEPAIYTASNQPALFAESVTADSGNLDYEFLIDTATAAYDHTNTVAADLPLRDEPSGAQESLSPADWGGQTLSDGNYTYSVRACDDPNTGVCSAFSSWIPFVVDRAAPSAPSTSPVLHDTDSFPYDQPLTNVNLVPGVSNPAAAAVYAYEYSTTASMPSTYDNQHIPACGSLTNGVYFVCAAGSHALAHYAPLGDTTSTLYAWAYSKAGALSPQFVVTPHVTGASIANGHSWATDSPSGSDCQPGPVADSATSANTPTPLQLSGTGTCWHTSGDSNDQFGGAFGAIDQYTTSATTSVQTSAQVLNTTQGFTVGAWVDSSTPGTGYQTAIGEAGPNHSMFYLQIDPTGRFRFCMAPQTTPATLVCATQATAYPQAHTWRFVVGEYDSANQQIRLYVDNSGNNTAAATTSWDDSNNTTNATGPLTIGSSMGGSTTYDQWNGAISDAFAIQGIATPNQRSNLYAGLSPSNA